MLLSGTTWGVTWRRARNQTDEEEEEEENDDDEADEDGKKDDEKEDEEKEQDDDEDDEEEEDEDGWCSWSWWWLWWWSSWALPSARSSRKPPTLPSSAGYLTPSGGPASTWLSPMHLRGPPLYKWPPKSKSKSGLHAIGAPFQGAGANKSILYECYTKLNQVVLCTTKFNERFAMLIPKVAIHSSISPWPQALVPAVRLKFWLPLKMWATSSICSR